MIEIVLALSGVLSSRAVRTMLGGRSSISGNVAGAEADLAGAIIPAMLSAHSQDGPSLVTLEAKLNRLAAQRYNSTMEIGCRYLNDAAAYFRQPADRVHMLERARHAFMDAAASAVTTEGAVGAELYLAGSWLAEGSIPDTGSALKSAHDRCLGGLLAACDEYRITPGLKAYWDSKSFLAQTLEPVEKIHFEGRTKIRESSARKLRELGALFNTVQDVRRKFGMDQAACLLKGYSIGKSVYIPPEKMTAHGHRIEVCQPVLADHNHAAQIGPLRLSEVNVEASATRRGESIYLLKGHFGFRCEPGSRTEILSIDLNDGWRAGNSYTSATLAPHKARSPRRSDLARIQETIAAYYKDFARWNGIKYVDEPIEMSDATVIKYRKALLELPTEIAFQLAFHSWRSWPQGSAAVLLYSLGNADRS